MRCWCTAALASAHVAALASTIVWFLSGDTAVAQRGTNHVTSALVVLALLTGLGAASAWSAAPYSFDAPDQYLTPAEDYQRWADLAARHRSQSAAIDTCLDDAAACPDRLRGYREIVVQAQHLSALRKLTLVNRFINTRRWHIERSRHDDWRTLTDFLRQGGDCEDYAIAKYFALRQVGFAADDVRVGISWDFETHAHHAVTVVRIDDQVYFLDVDGSPRRNQTSYRLLFSINEIAIWDHVLPAHISEGERS